MRIIFLSSLAWVVGATLEELQRHRRLLFQYLLMLSLSTAMAAVFSPSVHARQAETTDASLNDEVVRIVSVPTSSSALAANKGIAPKIAGTSLAVEALLPAYPKPYSDITLIARAAGQMANTIRRVNFTLTRHDGRVTTLTGNAMQNPAHYQSIMRALASGEYTVTATAWDGNGASLETSLLRLNLRPRGAMLPPDIVVPPPPANVPPAVALNTPTMNASFTLGATIDVSASGTDADGSITRMELFADAAKIGDATTATIARTWMPTAVGVYRLTAKATDDKGAATVSAAITINVNAPAPPPPPPPPPPPANVPPTVNLTASTINNSITIGTTINIAATASDSDGSVAKVELFAGTTKLGEDTTAPYTWSWTPTVIGTYSLTARATDDKGAITTSAAVSVTVNAVVTPPANVAPTVSLTGPMANSSVSVGNTINIAANAADSDGTVSKVEFFAGTTKLGEDINAPYTFQWKTTTAGTYNLTARATDDKNAVTTSAAVSVTVNAVVTPPPANVAPTVSLSAPTVNTSVAVGDVINIAASAVDSDGTVSKVEFFAGTTKLGEDSAAPYTFVWTTTTAGTYSLTARATDDKNAVTTSAAMSVTVTAPPPPPTSSITPAMADAARLLTQTTFGATKDQITRVAGLTPTAYLNEQFAIAQTSHVATVLANPNYPNAPWSVMSPSIWKQYFEANDQLRQRIVFALSQILVISMQNNTLGDQACSTAGYLDMLGRHAFGNFRDILRDATLSPAMGEYLDMKGSAKANPALNSVPNENYARELLQLFSIGTVMLNVDGSVQFANGKPIDTYSEETVQEFARALTGWTFANQDQTKPWRWLYPDVPYPNDTASGQKACTAWSTPMQPWTASYRSSDDKTTITGGAHDMGAKTLLNYPGANNFKRQLPANQTAQKDLEDVIDNIFNHPNVGPFIGEQLIQRLVMSNPSGGYVSRVTAAFNNNGAGVRGDMKAVISAVLLDSEARLSATSQPAAYGKLREPVLRFTHLHRAFGAKMSGGDYSSIWDLGGADAIGQSPLRAPSVFNFYHTDYAPSGVLLTQGLVGPEFEITNSATISGFMDFSKWGIVNGFNQNDSDKSKWLKPNYDEYIALAGNPAAMIDALNLVLLSGSMSPQFRTSLIDMTTKLTDSNATTQATERFRTAFWHIMNSPEYSIQK